MAKKPKAQNKVEIKGLQKNKADKIEITSNTSKDIKNSVNQSEKSEIASKLYESEIMKGSKKGRNKNDSKNKAEINIKTRIDPENIDVNLKGVPIFDEILKYEAGIKEVDKNDTTILSDEIRQSIQKPSTTQVTDSKRLAKVPDRFEGVSSKHDKHQFGIKSTVSQNHEKNVTKVNLPKSSKILAIIIVIIVLLIVALSFQYFNESKTDRYIENGECHLKITTVVKGDKTNQDVSIPGSKCHTDSECVNLLIKMNFDRNALEKATAICKKI